MNKINFTNLPDQTTPVNASNMNLLQTNVENAINEPHNAISSFLENSWGINGFSGITIMPNGAKLLTISVRNGTDRQIMTLPSTYRPGATVLANASNGQEAGYVTINTNGTVLVSNNIYSSGASNLLFSVIYW